MKNMVGKSKALMSKAKMVGKGKSKVAAAVKMPAAKMPAVKMPTYKKGGMVGKAKSC